MLALVIFSNSESMEKNFFKKYNNYLTWIIFTSFVVSLLLISYARFETNINNKIYLFGERDKIQKKVDKIKFSKLPKYVLKNERMELVTIPPFEKKMNVLLIIDSFECKPCVDEILFINNLKNKYKEKVGFFCIVKQIGKTAISNLKQKYSIQFPVLQDERNRLFSDLYISPFSIKLLVSKNGSILYIDPPAFQINSIQQIFIDRLEMALR
jgi:peroxiredoxin